MPQFSNIMGIVGNQFKIGMGEKAPSIFATPDGQLYFNAPIQIKGRVEGQPYVPSEPDDLATLDVVEKLNSKTFTDACNFAKNLILQSGGAGGGEGGETTPPTLIIQNAMPDPVTFETMENAYSLSLGALERDKYIHQIAVELEQLFTASDDSRYEVAIGTTTTQNAFVDWFEITALKKSTIFDVVKTVNDNTEVKLYVRDWVDPNPWVQRVLNPHETATISIKSSDAKKRIYEVTIHCDTIPPDEDVVHTDIFGTDILGKGYLDFGIPIKLKKNGHYRITQINNPALAEYNGKDPDVDVNDGVWSKSSTIGPFGTGFNEEDGAQYFFLLGQSQGTDDYMHIYVYDLDATDSDTAIWVFHIKNEIMTITPDPVPIPGDATFSYLSASEGTITTEKQEDGTYIVNLSGEILDKKDQILIENIPENAKLTALDIAFSGYTSSTIRIMIQDPAYEYFYNAEDTSEGAVRYNDGVYYGIISIPVTNGTFQVSVLVSDKPGDINVIVLGDSDQEADLVTIVNNVTFITETDQPETSPETSETEVESGEAESIPDETVEDSSVEEDAQSEPVPARMMRAAAAVDTTVTKTGRAKIRMIVF